MNLRLTAFSFFISATAACTFSQAATREMTLDEAIAMARMQSVDAAVALDELKSTYWEYRTFRADLLPEINFSASAPGYSKQYTPYQLDDGSYTFVRNNFMEMTGEISVSQSIWLTGGTLSCPSRLPSRSISPYSAPTT